MEELCEKKNLSESDLIHLIDRFVGQLPISIVMHYEMISFPLLTSLLEKDVARREEKQR